MSVNSIYDLGKFQVAQTGRILQARRVKTLWTLIVGVVLTAQSGTSGAEFFVAPNGADSGAGTKTRPFRSFERAQQAVRRAAQADGESITVWIAGGDYPRTNALEFGKEDSGRPGGRVSWRGVPGERVRLLGGVVLKQTTLVSDSQVLARLPEPARKHVRQGRLPSGTGAVSMASRGFSRPATPAGYELFYGGKPLTLARWPNTGEWERVAGFPEDGAEKDGHGGTIGKIAQGFFYTGDRPRGWQDVTNAWVHGYWAWDWANSYERVASIDLERRHIMTAPPGAIYGFRKGQRFHYLNVLEELDQPGEYFVDAAAGLVLFWPPASTDQKSSAPDEVLVSLVSEPLIRLRDVSHLELVGFTFEAGRGNALEISGGSSNRVAGCVIRNMGNWGVMMKDGRGHSVTSCDILDTGDGGISVTGGDRQTLQSSGHSVGNCQFSGQGRWSKCYVPAVLVSGVGTRVSHNLVYDHPHCAILFNGNDHMIEFNEIHHVALETGDVGAIYTGRDYTYRGNVIRHNFIHHTGGVGMGSMGVYMDDCVSGTEIYGNVFYKVQRAAFLGGGRDHRVVNNIFVDCNHALELDGRGLDPSPVWRANVDKTMRDRLKAVPAELYRTRYPEMKSLDKYYGAPGGPVISGEAFKGVPPEGNIASNNICVGKWLKVYWHAKPEHLLLSNNMTNAGEYLPLLTREAPAAADFAIRKDSPVVKAGFREIPTGRIGPRMDDLRKTYKLGLDNRRSAVGREPQNGVQP